jgi:hypothetical protein
MRSAFRTAEIVNWGGDLMDTQILARAVEAEAFVLVDATGRRRAVLTTRAEGTVCLSLIDPDGKVRAGIEGEPEGRWRLVFADKNGTNRVALGVTADGSPLLAFTDQDGVVIWTAPDQMARMPTLTDDESAKTADLPSSNPRSSSGS